MVPLQVPIRKKALIGDFSNEGFLHCLSSA